MNAATLKPKTAAASTGGSRPTARLLSTCLVASAMIASTMVASAMVAGIGFAGSASAQSLAGNFNAGEWTKVLATAKKEGTVNLYSAQPAPLITRLVTGFKAANPDIPIEFVRLTSGALLAKVDQERAAGADGADVVITSEVAWTEAFAKAGNLLTPAGPATAEWPSRYVRSGAVIIAGLEPFVIPYNVKLASPAPKGYADLLRPEFKGKLSTSELNATGNIAWYDWLEKTQGADFLLKLKAQNPRIVTGSVPAAQSVAAGEHVIAALGLPSSAKPMIQQGAPIDYVVPNPAFGVEYPIAAGKWSKRPNAALVLLDFLMSRAGQTAWHGQGETASPLPNIAGSLAAATITPYDPAAYPPSKVQSYREYWTKIFK